MTGCYDASRPLRGAGGRGRFGLGVAGDLRQAGSKVMAPVAVSLMPTDSTLAGIGS
jgi:hypothetical protein